MQVIAHAAGALGQDAIAEVTNERTWAVCSPKIVAACVLAEIAVPILEMPIFSSTAAAWSQPGACHYSAANCVLDANCNDLRSCTHQILHVF